MDGVSTPIKQLAWALDQWHTPSITTCYLRKNNTIKRRLKRLLIGFIINGIVFFLAYSARAQGGETDTEFSKVVVGGDRTVVQAVPTKIKRSPTAGSFRGID
jgi:hypothetical protein